MSQAQYNGLLSTIQAIPDAETLSPNMPVATFLQEAADLAVWNTPDQSALVAVGVPQATFDGFQDRIGALRYAESQWSKERNSQEEARQQWNTELPEALTLKNQLEHGFRFAFRSRQDLLTKVRQIEAGSGSADFVQDLSDLSVLGKANVPLLEAISLDPILLDTAEAKATEMSNLLAAMNGERAEGNVTIVIRNKAYTYLKQADDEIRAAGKYVFWKNEQRRKGYLKKYYK